MSNNTKNANRSVGSEILKHVMTGISYMIPMIVMGGLMLAIAKLCGGVFVADKTGTFWYYIAQAGTLAMNMATPILAAYICYSICDRPGIAPGFLTGTLANTYSAGFLGGMLGAFIVGYVLLLIKTKVKFPKVLEPMVPIMILPLIGGLVGTICMSILIGPPIAKFMAIVVEKLYAMDRSQKFLFGMILGMMIGVDMGGAVNKTACTVANGLFADGITQPVAGKICANITPPLGCAFSALVLTPKKYTKQERDAAKAAIPMGLVQIAEGAIPFAAADPLRVLPGTIIGSGITFGICMALDVASPVPHGGIIGLPLMENAWGFVIALIVGTIVTGGIISLLKLNKPDATEEVAEEEDNGDDSDIDFDITIG